MMGVITPTVSVPTVPAPGETDVVAVVASGRSLAAAARRAWDEGRAILPVNPAFTASEIETLLARLRPTHLEDGRRRDGVPATADVVAVVVTSGTTGVPKGVELTRAGMEAMGRSYSDALGATAADRWLVCLPLHHVASLGILARSLVTNVPCTIHDGFDVARVAASPSTEGTTLVSVVPTALKRLLDAGAPVHQYRRVIVGGAPFPGALRARAEAAGAPVVDAYGLSETWGGFALDGSPIASAEAHVDGARGEILVRGAMVMRGYRLDPLLTADARDDAGWLRTGDTGTQDADGRLTVTDRLKDVIISGGVNVSPTEVEGVLARHPRVADVCVVGTPDDEWVERVVAVVVPARDADPSLRELREFAAEHLSPAKLPRELRLVDTIPRTVSGKPLRRLLRDLG